MQHDRIAAPNPFQFPKVGIAMAGDADVAALADQSCALDVSDALIERPAVGAFQQNVR
jgi:hypothetical protein